MITWKNILPIRLDKEGLIQIKVKIINIIVQLCRLQR